MATIGFLMDIEEGHIFPSFGLARSLQEKGHSVFYASIPDNRYFVEKMGFVFYEVLVELYPPGFSQEFKILRSTASQFYNQSAHLRQIMDGAFDELLKQTNADLLIISAFLEVESLLLYYRFRLPTVIFTPILRNPDVSRVRSCLDHIGKLPEEIMPGLMKYLSQMGAPSDIKELIQPMREFYELIPCPPEFELNKQLLLSNTFYIEPSIRQMDDLVINSKDHHTEKFCRIIYASLGSQTIRYGAVCQVFFTKMIAMMQQEEMRDMHLILAIGRDFDRSSLGPAPGNVTVVEWVSQIEVIKTASLVITHGGLGTVKESIFYGVPLLVFPQRHDQPHIAELVSLHKIGVRADTMKISVVQLVDCVQYILGSHEISRNIQKMQAIFRRTELEKPGVRLIERLLYESSERCLVKKGVDS